MASKKTSIVFPKGLVHGTCVLNFTRNPGGEFAIYADAFHRAAKALLLKLEESRGYNDCDACPIVFLYRHSFELYLKATLHSGERVLSLSGDSLGIDAKVLNDHKLLPLAKSFAKLLPFVHWEWVKDVRHMESAGNFLGYAAEFDNIDGGSFSFRYPTKKNRKTPNLSHHFSFNVIEFSQTLDPILETLDGAVEGLEELFADGIEAST
jgi:hypothetical protein